MAKKAKKIPQIIEHTLQGDIDKVALAIERLREFEPPEGFFGADSYGKDSECILALMDMAGVKHDDHHNRTTLDPPELMRFGRRNHPNTQEHAPKERFEVTLLRKRMPPMRNVRWCCETLKEGGGKGRIIVTGIRAAESVRRSKRRMFETCYKDSTKHYLNPIIDWTTTDVWEFHRRAGLPHCELYDQGWERIGCLMCPMVSSGKRQREAALYPRFKRRYVRAFQRLVELGKPDGTPVTWKTGEELFDWWIGPPPARKMDAPGQVIMLDQDE